LIFGRPRSARLIDAAIREAENSGFPEIQPRFFRLFGNAQGKHEAHENHSRAGADFSRSQKQNSIVHNRLRSDPRPRRFAARTGTIVAVFKDRGHVNNRRR
jgi:hypothetical protein